MTHNEQSDRPEREGGAGRYLAIGAGALLALGGAAFYFFMRTERGFRTFLYRLYRREFPDVALISPDELAAAMEGDDPPALIDTRAPKEYMISHLRDARLVDPKTFGQVNLIGLRKDEPIVVYCSVGYRSGHMAKLLAEMGYANVRNLYGGIFLWFNQERPVYSAGRRVDRIHLYDRVWGRFVTRGERVL